MKQGQGFLDPYLSPTEIAAALGRTDEQSLRRLRRFLATAGILEPHGGHRTRVSKSRLESQLRDLYDLVFAYYVLGDDPPRAKPSPGPRGDASPEGLE
jgi:hypothetical protein